MPIARQSVEASPDDAPATKIQASVRCFLASRLLKQKRKQQQKEALEWVPQTTSDGKIVAGTQSEGIRFQDQAKLSMAVQAKEKAEKRAREEASVADGLRRELREMEVRVARECAGQQSRLETMEREQEQRILAQQAAKERLAKPSRLEASVDRDKELKMLAQQEVLKSAASASVKSAGAIVRGGGPPTGKANNVRRIWQTAEDFVKQAASGKPSSQANRAAGPRGRASLRDLIEHLYQTRHHSNFGVWLASHRGLSADLPAGEHTSLDMEALCRLLADYEAGKLPGSGTWVQLLAGNPKGFSAGAIVEKAEKLEAARVPRQASPRSRNPHASDSKAWLSSSYRRAWSVSEDDPLAGSAQCAVEALVQLEGLLDSEALLWQQSGDQLAAESRALRRQTSTKSMKGKISSRRRATLLGDDLEFQHHLSELGDLKEDYQAFSDQQEGYTALLKTASEEAEVAHKVLTTLNDGIRHTMQEVVQLRAKLAGLRLTTAWSWEGSGFQQVVAAEVEAHLLQAASPKALEPALEKFVHALDPALAEEKARSEAFQLAVADAVAKREKQGHLQHERRPAASMVPMEAVLRGFSNGLLKGQLGRPPRHL
eukprot:TRINITY_DN58735_c0_g1_i1.p1 TRINITY_DN58735_c0_g1~~TRINITY_DN58735_c0_g1_i1.p1  ORF type:complete len:628 (+),score=169.16 TRINITY_DN58735_c0_g1_i1:87-1886(+)